MNDDHKVPTLSTRDLQGLLLEAWADAPARPMSAASARDLRAVRSQHFVCALGDALAAHYEEFPDVHVFCRGRRQGVFPKREEFLFDVLVARVSTVTSSVHKSSLPFIRAPLLQVESEFAYDTRETALDASKLVCGAAPQSLVVAPATLRPDNYLAPLAAIARHVQGEMFVAFVAHPEHWGRTALAPALYRWVTDRWLLVGD